MLRGSKFVKSLIYSHREKKPAKAFIGIFEAYRRGGDRHRGEFSLAGTST